MIVVPAIIHFAKACEKHLVAEDPYQYEDLTNQQLVNVRIRHAIEHWPSPALENEIKRRLQTELSYEDRETLTKCLEWK